MLDCNLKDNSLIQINIEGKIGEIEGTPSEASVWADKLKASLARAVYVGVGLPLEMWANKKKKNNGKEYRRPLIGTLRRYRRNAVLNQHLVRLGLLLMGWRGVLMKSFLRMGLLTCWKRLWILAGRVA